MPQYKLTGGVDRKKKSHSHVNAYFSHSTAFSQHEKTSLVWEEEINYITRQTQNNSFTMTCLTFLRFPVKWNPADIHFASPAIVKSRLPSCYAVWARHPVGFSSLAHHSFRALSLLCPSQVVLGVDRARTVAGDFTDRKKRGWMSSAVKKKKGRRRRTGR